MTTLPAATTSGKTYPRGVAFTLECLPEDIPVRGNAIVSGDEDFDRKCEDEILAELEWNEWAWCCVKATAHYEGFEGTDYLGGCNYKNEEQFREPGGYWEDMKAAAFADLIANLEAAVTALHQVQDGGAI